MADQMAADSLAAIRDLLIAAFTAEELRRFLQDRPTFRPVVDQIGPDYGLDDMVDEVVDYCERRLLLDELRDEVERYIRQPDRFEGRFSVATDGGIQSRRREAQKLLDEGERALADGDTDRSLELVQRALDLYQQAGDRPGEAASLHAVGRAAQVRGDYGAAEHYFRNSREVYEELGDKERVALNSLHLGQIAFAQGNYTWAEEELKQAIELEPENAAAYTWLGRIYIRRGEYDMALSPLNRAVELDPNDASAFAQRGELYRQREEYPKALEDLDRAVELEPEDAWTLARRGDTHRLLGNLDAARDDFMASYQLDSEDAWMLAHRGETFRQMGNYESARRDFDAALHRNPDDIWALALRGETYRQMEKYQEALADLNRAVERSPNDAWILARRGETYRQTEEYEKALADFDKALDLKPDDAWTLARRGETYLRMDLRQEARADLTRAMELDPEEGERARTLLTLMNVPRELPRPDQALVESQELEDEEGPADEGAAQPDLEVHVGEQAQVSDGGPADLVGQAQQLLDEGRMAEGSGDYDLAYECYEESHTIFSRAGGREGLAASALGLGRAALGRDLPPQAKEHFEEAQKEFQWLRDRQGVAQALLGLGQAARELNDWGQARNHLERAQKYFEQLDDPGHLAEATLALGWLAVGDGDMAQADRYASQADELYKAMREKPGEDAPPLLSRMGRELAEIWLEAGRWALYDGELEPARRRLTASLLQSQELDDRAGEAQSLHLLGCVYLEQGDLDAAEKALKESRDLYGMLQSTVGEDPSDALEFAAKVTDNLFYLARVDLARGDLDWALAGFNEVLEREPERAEAYAWRGEAHYTMPNLPAALEDLNRALKLDPNDAWAWVRRGLVRREMGDKDGALEDLNRALELNPEDNWAREQREELLKEMPALLEGGEGSEPEPVEGEEVVPEEQEVGEEPAEVPGGPPVDMAGEPPTARMWLVVAKPEQYDWERAFASFELESDRAPIRWTEVTQPASQNRLRRSREGDYVLAYTSERPSPYITGLGRIASDPYDLGDRHAVDIRLTRGFPRRVTLKTIREAVPDLEKARVAQISFTPVTPEQWAIIRRLILRENPDADLEDLLPAAVAEVREPEEEQVPEEEKAPEGPEPSEVTPGRPEEEPERVPDKPAPTESVELTIDTSLPDRVKVGDTFDLALSVRRPDQPQRDLADLGQIETGDPPPAPGDDGLLRLELSAPECALDGKASRAFRLQPAGDPPLFRFRLTPKTPGVIPVIVRVYEQDTLLSKTSLHTEAYEEVEGAVESKVVSVALPAPPGVMVWQGHDNPPPTPPWSDDWVTLEVDMATVTLTTSDGARYRSKNKLDHRQLKAEGSLPPEHVGHLLFEGLINADGSKPGFKHRPTSKGFEHALAAANGPLRVVLDVRPDHPNYTWEYLKDPSMELPLSLREKAPFFRLYSSAGKAPVQATPIRILFAICNPRTLRRSHDEALDGRDPVISALIGLNVGLERDTIAKAQAKLVNLKGQALAECDILERSATGPVTLATIRDALKVHRYHVLHLLAHGVFVENREKYALVLEDNDGDDALVYADDFDQTLADYGLRLVVLAACDSAAAGVGPALKALAPRLIETGVPAVIAMQRQVPVTTAQAFTQQFYGDLARTGRVDMALAATRYELYLRDRMGGAWAIPLLMMSRRDGQLFKVDESGASTLPRPRSEELDVRDYEDLGVEDPTSHKVTRAVEKQLQAYGYGRDRMMAHAVRAVLAPGLASRPPEAETLAAGQDRRELEDLAQSVSLQASELQSAVEADSQLEVPNGTYDQIASALNAGKHIILIGPPGTGKTTLAQSVCRCAVKHKITKDFVLTTATADWTTFDTVGGYVPTQEGSLQFRPGIFLEAVSRGRWLIIDEINRAEIDKAFGELFTVLSGQRVDLPYKVRGQEVSIMPPARKGEGQPATPWTPRKAVSPYHYVMHPNWRIIGTMNVYDKSTLFQLSHAFMRRFAFIDLDPPPDSGFFYLVDRWLMDQGVDAAPPPEPVLGPEGHPLRNGAEWGDCEPMQRVFRRLLHRDLRPGTELDGKNPLMQRRALGPAMVKDMIEYIGDRWKFIPQANRDQQVPNLMGEAFLLYVVPQLDGLDYEGIIDLHEHIQGLFKEETAARVRAQILRRIELLYPHIHEWKRIGQEDEASRTDK